MLLFSRSRVGGSGDSDSAAVLALTVAAHTNSVLDSSASGAKQCETEAVLTSSLSLSSLGTAAASWLACQAGDGG